MTFRYDDVTLYLKIVVLFYADDVVIFGTCPIPSCTKTQLWYLIVSIPDLCLLLYLFSHTLAPGGVIFVILKYLHFMTKLIIHRRGVTHKLVMNMHFGDFIFCYSELDFFTGQNVFS